jgi:four helix bundle protein
MSFEFYDTQFKASTATLQASATTSETQELKDFKKLSIWQLSIEILHKVYDVIPMLPEEERYGMRSHMKKTATALPLKIEEGCMQNEVNECIKRMEIALSHAYDLDTQLGIVQKRKWADARLTSQQIELVREEQTMLKTFIGKIIKG